MDLKLLRGNQLEEANYIFSNKLCRLISDEQLYDLADNFIIIWFFRRNKRIYKTIV